MACLGLICGIETRDAFWAAQMDELLHSVGQKEMAAICLAEQAGCVTLASVLEEQGLCPGDCVFIGEESAAAKEADALGMARIGLERPGGMKSSASYVMTSLSGIGAREIVRIYERFHHLPWIITMTERLLIREITTNDVDALFEMYRPKEVSRYLSPLHPTREEEIVYIHDYIRYMYSFYECGMWVICDKKSGNVIGRAGIEVRSLDGEQIAELGYMVALPYQRQGIASEAVDAVLSYVEYEGILPEFREVNCLIAKENVPSQNFAKKMGFILTGTCICDQKLWLRYRKPLQNKEGLGII
jgi:RimJ/RimL family protein N-acetyltransferase